MLKIRIRQNVTATSYCSGTAACREVYEANKEVEARLVAKSKKLEFICTAGPRMPVTRIARSWSACVTVSREGVERGDKSTMILSPLTCDGARIYMIASNAFTDKKMPESTKMKLPFLYV